MRYSADIYELVKSLSKAEKRYFKIFATQHTKGSNNNYILLFDAIARQDQYNEGKLRHKFREYTFSKNIAKTKYLLHELILKMLRQLHNGKSARSRIVALIESADYLYERCLFDQAYTNLQKAKKLVIFFEHYGFWLQILMQEEKLIGNLKNNNPSVDKLKRVEELCRIKALLNLELDYKLLLEQTQLSLEYADHELAQNETLSLDQIVTSELVLNGDTLAKTFLSRVYYHEIQVLQALAVHKYDQAFRHLETIHLLWNENPEKREIYAEEYKRFCTCYMNCCTNAKVRGSDYDELLHNLQNFGRPDSKERERNFFLASIYDFIFNLTLGSLEFCAIQVFTIRDMIAEHAEKLSQADLINLFYHMSVFYFLKGEYNETLNWIDKIQMIDTKKRFQNIQSYCKLLSLMAKYGENELEVLEYDIYKAYRFLSKGKKIKPIEKLILTSVKQLLNKTHIKDETKIFANLYTALDNYYRNDINTLAKLTAGNAIYQWVRNKLPNDDRSLLN